MKAKLVTRWSLPFLLWPATVSGRRLGGPLGETQDDRNPSAKTPFAVQVESARRLWDNPNLDVVFIVDGSGTVGASDWVLQKAGLISAINNPNVVPRTGIIGISVVQFDSDGDVAVPYRLIDSASAASEVVQGINLMQRKGTTAHPGEGVASATEHIKNHARGKARQVFCMTTDQIGTEGEITLEKAVKKAKRESFKLDTFSVVAIRNQNVPDQTYRNYFGPVVHDGKLAITQSTQDFLNSIESACFDYDPAGQFSVVATIETPKPGQIFYDDETIKLRASVDQPYSEIVWSVDGTPTVTGKRAQLNAGPYDADTHDIGVYATSPDGFNGPVQTIQIEIKKSNLPPVVSILKPGDGESFLTSQTIKLKATATDPEDGEIPDWNVLWYTGSTQIGSGKNTKVEGEDLGVDTHFIRVVATDSKGLSSTAQRTIEVREPYQNLKPVVTMISPSSGSTYWDTDMIPLSCTVVDPEGEVIPDGKVIWSSEKGAFASGKSAKASANDARLGPGTHFIEVKATDSENLTGSAPTTAMITIYATNTPPQVAITQPLHMQILKMTDWIRFQCSISDDRDSNLNGNYVVWTSSKNGIFAYGRDPLVYVSNTLSLGRHQITVTATDYDGASSSASVIIKITQGPLVSIEQPQPGAAYMGEAIKLQATATTGDGKYGIADPQVIWTTDQNLEIGRGTYASLHSSFLYLGNHEIIVTATDQWGQDGQDSVVINVVAPLASSAMKETNVFAKDNDGDE